MDREEFNAAFALMYGDTMSWSVSNSEAGGIATVVARPEQPSGWCIVWMGVGETEQDAFEQMVKFFVQEGFR